MPWQFVSAVLRPAMRVWLGQRLRSLRSLPKPTDVPHVHTSGVHADRILLLGNGASTGFGVLSHGLALPGHLARQLSLRTGRATDIDVIADVELTAARCLDVLRGTDLERFDAIVMTVGVFESLTQLSPHQWSRDLRLLLDRIERLAPASLRVFLVSIPRMDSVSDFPRLVQWLSDSQATRLNEHTRIVSADYPRVTYVPFSPTDPRDVDRYRSTDTYEKWAALIAPRIANVLNSRGNTARGLDSTDERQRQKSLDTLGILDTEPEERFDRIVRAAKDLLDTSGAALSFIDHDRQWFKSARGSGLAMQNTPRSSAICNITVRRAEQLVIEDAGTDARFQRHPLVIGPPFLRFYAGYAIEAPDGQRVGVLCVVDTKPRTFSRNESALLRDLALQVQAELWARQTVSAT